MPVPSLPPRLLLSEESWHLLCSLCAGLYGPLAVPTPHAQEAVKVYSQHRELCPRPHPQTQGEDVIVEKLVPVVGKVAV